MLGEAEKTRPRFLEEWQQGRQALRDGYVYVLQDLYQPEAFFGRLDDLYLKHRMPFFSAMRAYNHRHPGRRLVETIKNLGLAAGLFARLMWYVPDAALRREYRRRLARMLRERPDPYVLFIYAAKCAMHYHHHTMAARMAVGQSTLVN
jgi:Domain of unknown function (DUF4070)